MLEESSSEVTSSSAGLIMSPSIALSPNSLGSPEYGELDLWGYDDNPMHASHGHNSAAGNTHHHHHPSNGIGGVLSSGGGGGGAGVGPNQNGIHSHHHHSTAGGGAGGGTAAVLQPGNNHHLLHNSLSHGNGNHHGSGVGGLGSAVSLMNNVVGAAHINRLAQGMVNELLAANGGNGLIAVENLIGHGNGVTNNANMGSSRSSTSPSIGKLKCSRWLD